MYTLFNQNGHFIKSFTSELKNPFSYFSKENKKKILNSLYLLIKFLIFFYRQQFKQNTHTHSEQKHENTKKKFTYSSSLYNFLFFLFLARFNFICFSSFRWVIVFLYYYYYYYLSISWLSIKNKIQHKKIVHKRTQQNKKKV